MMTIPSKPWTSTAQAMLHGRKFRNHVKRCRSIADTRFTGQHTTWRFPDFARQGRGDFR
jgi:hypothetical protein